ncbi:MAG: hypothetical protein EAX81_07680 [Candidatus Thorarchaeota archaeon]|nr:hypothetical protein [Candidatus Thorarchaeota archaeon]
MTEEKKFPRIKPAKLSTVRNLSAETEGPVKIIGIVIESSLGMALIQDILDDVDKAGRIIATVEGTLNETEKYILIGNTTEKDGKKGKELRFAANLAYNVNDLDIKTYKEVLELESEVVKTLSR